MRTAVGLTAGLSLDGDRCIRVIPRQEPEQAKVEPNPFLQPHLPEIHEMTEELEETDLDNM